MKNFFLLNILVALVSCVATDPEKAVVVHTSGLSNAVSLSVDLGVNLGEFTLPQEPHTLTVTVLNTTSMSITDMDMAIPEATDFFFVPNDDGDTLYPGLNGSCGSTLASNSSCTIKITFVPRSSQEYEQIIELSYTNAYGIETESLTLTALSGNPASLFFTSEQSTYDFGVKERTEKVVRFQTLEVKNGGELTAKSVSVSLSTADDDDAYQIITHNCPVEMEPQESCEVLISYEPMNWELADPDTNERYSAALSLSYIKNPVGDIASLNGSFTFLSTNIEGNFTSVSNEIEFSELISGNTESQAIKITNKGYRESTLQKIVVLNSDESEWAYCDSPDANSFLVCKDPSDDHLLTLEEFPFKLKETTACVGQDTPGVTPTSSGSSCYFEVIFWPSAAYNTTTKDFSGIELRFNYDSHWRDLETIRDVDLYTVTEASSVHQGKLEITNLEYADTDYTQTIVSESIYSYELGRLALISNEYYAKRMTITVKNTGGSTVDLTHLKDGKGNIFTINPSTVDIMWKDTLHSDCTTLDPLNTCIVTLTFVPMAPNDPSTEEADFYDVNNSVTDRYKQFILTYGDGATLNDDGTSYVDKTVETRVSGTLVRKGYLVFDRGYGDRQHGNYVSGTTNYLQFVLFNAGTGKIPYIQAVANYDLKVSGVVSPEQEIIAASDGEGIPAGVTKDCYDIVELDSTATPPATPVADEFLLLAGDSCVLTIRSKLAETTKVDSFTEEIERDFKVAWDNTNDSWLYDDARLDRFFMVNYYDGDFSKEGPDLVNFGDLKSTDQGQVVTAFQIVAVVNPVPLTPASSAVLYRPAITLPTIVGTPSLSGQSVSSMYLPVVGSAPEVLAENSVSHVSGLVDSTADFHLHLGTFSTGETFNISFALTNFGGTSTRVDAISLATASEMTFVSGNTTFPYFGPDDFHNVTIAFSSAAVGEFSDVLTYTYNNGVSDVTKTVKIIAEAVASYPVLDFELVPYEVLYDSGTEQVVETLKTASTSTLTQKYYESTSSSAASSVSLEAVKGSVLYDKKRIKVTNNAASPVSANSLEMYIDSSNTSLTVVVDTCSSSSLAAGESCYVDFKFLPTDGTSSFTAPIVLNYLIAAGQYTKASVIFDLTALSPAELSVLSLNTMQISAPHMLDPTRPSTYSSYPIDYGGYTNANHIVLTDYPVTVYQKSNVTIRNSSNLKASFLPGISGPVPPGDPVEIYSDGGKRVLASRSCLYGDDESDGGVPDDEKGFNDSSTSDCVLTFEFDADDTYIGGMINTYDNLIHVPFYDFKRYSTDYLHFHFQGFVESNRTSAASTAISNVIATSDGEYSFEWSELIPDNSSWGAVTGYRVFHSDTIVPLSNVYQMTPAYEDVTGASSPEVVLSGAPGTYKYTKIMALRSIGGLEYISESGFPVHKILIPPSGTIYSHDLGIIVDQSYLDDGILYRDEAISACSGLYYILMDNGAPLNPALSRSLVSTTIWSFIESDELNSEYNIDAVPHWLSDDEIDISTIFAVYGYDPAVSYYYDSDENIGYSKSCSDNSCGDLHTLQGGDGFDVPVGARFYIEGDRMKGVSRCYAPVF